MTTIVDNCHNARTPEHGDSAAVAYASVVDVDTVVVDGILRNSGGELVDVDRATLVRDAEASRDRLLAQIGKSAEDLRFAGQTAVQQQ